MNTHRRETPEYLARRAKAAEEWEKIPLRERQEIYRLVEKAKTNAKLKLHSESWISDQEKRYRKYDALQYPRSYGG